MTDTTSQPHHLLHPHEVYTNPATAYQATGAVDPRQQQQQQQQQHHLYQQQQPPQPAQQPQPAYPMVSYI